MGNYVDYSDRSLPAIHESSNQQNRPGISYGQLLVSFLQGMGVTDYEQPGIPGYGHNSHTRDDFSSASASQAHYPSQYYNNPLPFIVMG